jgi:hypothetical protein
MEELWRDTPGNSQLPGGLTFEEILDKFLFDDDSLHEKILTLEHIYLDLSMNGSSSCYFVYIQDAFGPTLGM